MILGYPGGTVRRAGAKYAQYPPGELADVIRTVRSAYVECLVVSVDCHGVRKTGVPYPAVCYARQVSRLTTLLIDPATADTGLGRVSLSLTGIRVGPP